MHMHKYLLKAIKKGNSISIIVVQCFLSFSSSFTIINIIAGRMTCEKYHELATIGVALWMIIANKL